METTTMGVITIITSHSHTDFRGYLKKTTKEMIMVNKSQFGLKKSFRPLKLSWCFLVKKKKKNFLTNIREIKHFGTGCYGLLT